MIGRSAAFLNVLHLIERAAAYDVSILIEGETGTGKELAARAIHYNGLRHGNPFIPVNCGAIPENLLESEFFGHAKGAFTDAKLAKAGLVEQANGGTLFLDEVECLSSKGQIALLRFLQDQSYRPVGGQLRNANVRIIAASNRDLLQMVQANEFRMDLYYRLALISLKIPPLRERFGDPELLARHFIKAGSQRFGAPEKVLHPDTLEWLDRYHWPGNVRELENFIYREIILSGNDEIRTQRKLQCETKADRRQNAERRQAEWLNMPYQCAKTQAVKDFEQHYLTSLLKQANGNISAAARLAGKERRSFDRLLQKNGIDKIRFRG